MIIGYSSDRVFSLIRQTSRSCFQFVLTELEALLRQTSRSMFFQFGLAELEALDINCYKINDKNTKTTHNLIT